MQTQDNYITLIATISKLADKLQEQQYISSLQVNDEDITFVYKDGFKQKIPFPRTQNVDLIDTKIILNELKAVFREIIEARFIETLETLQNKLISEVKATMPTPRDGLDGKNSDEQIIVEELTRILQEKLEVGLLTIRQSIPEPIIPKDGKDADEKAITKALRYYIRQESDKVKTELFANINEVMNSIPIPKDGENGKDGLNGLDGLDADEKVLKDALFLELNNKITYLQSLFDSKIKAGLKGIIESIPTPKDGKDGVNADDQAIIDIILPKLYTLNKESTEDIKQELLGQIEQKIYEILLVLKPLKGEKGDAGLDADEQKIVKEVLQVVGEDVKKSQLLVQQELQEGLENIKSSIPQPKDGVDGKDGKSIKGRKGDRGNGIIDAKINDEDRLIIETDDKTIDAGEVSIKRFSRGGGGGGGSFLYTNELPMPVDVGLLPKGTKFKDTDLKVLFTKLLYGYNFPKFVDFLISGLLNNVEIGYSIIAGDYQANFTITDPELLRPDSITILKEGQVLLENLPNVSPVQVTLAGETKNTIDVINFEIFAYDTTGVSFNKYFTVNYKYRIYYGEYTEDITDTGFPNPLIVLRASELVIDIYGEYFFQNIPLGANYKWFCYPSILGENYIFYDTVSDIALILNDVLKISIVNEYGLVIEYNCYRTLNEIHEDIIMKVKNG